MLYLAAPTDILREQEPSYPYYGLPSFRYLSLATSQVGDLKSRQGALEDIKAFDDRRKTLEQELLSINAVRNTRVPVNRLPPELTAEIVLFVQADTRFEYTWPSLLLVCRHWHAVLSHAPRLWRNLVARASLNFLRTGLLRSKAIKIHVKILKPAYNAMLSNLLDAILPHITRIRKLDFDTIPRRYVPTVATFTRHSMPALEFLRISLDESPWSGDDTVVQFSPDRLPRLLGLSLSRMIILPSSSILKQLRTISLRCIGWQRTITLSMLRNTLRNCRAVEHLTISDVCVSKDDPERNLPPHPSHMVELPRLRSLTLSNTAPVLKHFFTFVKLSRTDVGITVDCQRGGKGDGPHELRHKGIRFLFPQERSTLPLLAECTHACIVATSTRHQVAGYVGASPRDDCSKHNGRITVTMDIPPRSSSSQRNEDDPSLNLFAALDVFRGLPATPLIDLSLRIDATTVKDVAWRRVFAYFPLLRFFSVHGDKDPNFKSTIHRIFRGLDPSRAPMDTPMGERVVCPELASVRIEAFAVSPDLVLEAQVCLRTRMEELGLERALDSLEFSFMVGWHDPGNTEDRRELFHMSLGQFVHTLGYEELEIDPLITSSRSFDPSLLQFRAIDRSNPCHPSK